MNQAEHITGTWDQLMAEGVKRLLVEYGADYTIGSHHIKDTPDRVVKAYREYFAGMLMDPASVLTTTFGEEVYDEMIVVKDIHFVSFCAHHLVPFFGKVHFGYIPNEKIVGLSKIPRLIEILSKRPQVQEKLTFEIAEIFQKTIEPKGCGVSIEATHLCMAIRGVKKEGVLTKTTVVRGVFKTQVTKEEFLNQIGGK